MALNRHGAKRILCATQRSHSGVGAKSGVVYSVSYDGISDLASDHKYLRICDLCKELGIACLHAHIAAERERQAKTDAGLVPLCPLASMVPVFWR
jgi:hypothetical protein